MSSRQFAAAVTSKAIHGQKKDLLTSWGFVCLAHVRYWPKAASHGPNLNEDCTSALGQSGRGPLGYNNDPHHRRRFGRYQTPPNLPLL